MIWLGWYGQVRERRAIQEARKVSAKVIAPHLHRIVMHLAKLLVYFETSPALRLLRSHNAPFVIDFLGQQFKRPGRITVPHSELSGALASYQEHLQDSYPDTLRDKPETYLTNWSSSDARWLHRFIEAGRNEPVYQLTPHTEDVFSFLDSVLEKDLGFVATESRLRLVIETLADLVIGASDDPVERVNHLRREKQRLDEEIERIEQEGSVTRYHATQIRERFAMAVLMLKQLQGDFRMVEEKFKEITRQVQQRQVDGNETRGRILEFALDSEDVLKQEDQGVSFYEFVRFILSPSQQEKLQSIIEQLERIDEVVEQSEGLETVRRMVPVLLAEAEKVMRTNQRLSSTLRRLLDVRAARERQRVAQLLREIRALAAFLSSSPPRDEVFFEVDTEVEVTSPFSRAFWSEPAHFEKADLAEHLADDDRRWETFRQLAQMHHLDWRTMQQRIRDTVAQKGSVTLGQLLAEYPPRAGMVEVVGYLQLAHDKGHMVYQESFEEIELPMHPGNSRPRIISIPLVTFIAK